MNNESWKKKLKVNFCRIAISLVAVFMLSFIVFQNIASANDEISSDEPDNSDFYIGLLEKTVSSLSAGENADDKKMFGGITFNPLSIIQNEISILDGYKLKKDSVALIDENDIKKASNIVINPFKLKDDAVNKKEANVDVVGNPEDNSKKKILIYHTHTNEAYAEGNSGLETTVAGVGDELTTQLESLGFTVVHDKTVHDVDYNNAYYASHETVLNNINTYGDFDLIIDLHRDGGPSKEKVTTEIDGESVAKIMFVTTETDPRYDAHISNLQAIIDSGNELYPGLLMDKSIYTYKSGIIYYSQDLSDNAMLMEVGADTSELQEAKNSMKYMSIVFAKYLNSK